MSLLLDLVFAFLGGWLALYFSRRAGAPEPLQWGIALVVALIVWAIHLSQYFV